MKLVGINGFKRSGKGTVADMLANQFEDKATYQIGFADKVKIAGARALGFLDLPHSACIGLMDVAKEHWLIEIRNMTDFHDFEVEQITGRQYLQNIGTEMRKLFGDDFWVDQVLPRNVLGDKGLGLNRVKEKYPGVDIVAITDLRFENEAQRVLDLGGVVWRVNRPGFESDGHDSEQRLPDELVSWEIWNNSGLDNLVDEVEVAIGETLS